MILTAPANTNHSVIVDTRQNPCLNWDLGAVNFFSDGCRMPGHSTELSFLLRHCKPAVYFFSQVTFTCFRTAYNFWNFSSFSHRNTSVTELDNLVTGHGHPLPGPVPCCFPSLVFCLSIEIALYTGK